MKVKKNPYLELLEIPPGYLNIMGYVDQSEVNDPGCRAVVWVQECLRECPGCFNPDSWSFEINQLCDRLIAFVIFMFYFYNKKCLLSTAYYVILAFIVGSNGEQPLEVKGKVW